HLSLPRRATHRSKRISPRTTKLGATNPRPSDTADEALIPLRNIRCLSVSSDETVDSLDSRYFYFFLSAMPHILVYANLFPKIITDIFSRSIPHRCLRQSVLSISSWVADHRLSRPSYRFQVQYISTLQSIQKSLEKMDIDEGTAIAVFLLLYI